MKTRHESGGFFLAARGGQAVLEPAGAAKKKRAPEGARVFHSEFGATAMPGGNRGSPKRSERRRAPRVFHSEFGATAMPGGNRGGFKGFAPVVSSASRVLAQKANGPA